MRRTSAAAAALAAALALFAAGDAAPPPAADPFADALRAAIRKHLGKPYVWGATGLKSYDCSGFIWRVMTEAGIPVKRTTARRLYLCLPKVPPDRQYDFGNLVFFDDLGHVGLVNSRADFFHAQLSRGTNLSPFSPYWRPKVCGFRALPGRGPKE